MWSSRADFAPADPSEKKFSIRFNQLVSFLRIRRIRNLEQEKPHRLNSPILPTAFAVTLALVLSGCTVEPLNSARSDSSLVSGSVSSSVSEILAATEVAPVSTRVGQQVRNRLLFSMNGGQLREGGRYRVTLAVQHATRLLSIEASSLSPTSAQVQVDTAYALIDKASGKTVETGNRRALASYDRTSQSFANKRAQRDAQDRAAREVAEQVRLAIAQYLTRS